MVCGLMPCTRYGISAPVILSKSSETKVSTLATQSGKQKILIAELDLNNPRYINPPSKGGFGLDGQWTDEFHHALHAVVTGETNGYYEDFGEVTIWQKLSVIHMSIRVNIHPTGKNISEHCL
jgi:1,4-alpha-glucan branching enzyme